MRITLQRVSSASVTVMGERVGAIKQGLVALVGFGHEDDETIINTAVSKITGLRIFNDTAEKMNLSLLDTKGAILAISQFTLYANCKRGKRPDFTQAAPPDKANHLFELFVTRLRDLGIDTQTGIFAADMKVSLINDGPVTINLEF